MTHKDNYELPEEFKDVPLKYIIDLLLVINELLELAETESEIGYWTGQYDSFVLMLSDFTGEPVTYKRKTYMDKLHSFRIEDSVEELQIEKDLKDILGDEN